MESLSTSSTVCDTSLTPSSRGTFPLGLSKSIFMNVTSSKASPGLIVVPLLQLYFRYPIAISRLSTPLLNGLPVSLFIKTLI